MKLPDASDAIVSQAKVVDYLLAENHPQGRDKAAFFTRLGFTQKAWQVLATVLAQHPVEHDVYRVEDSRFGRRYVIDGAIETPSGRRRRIRTVWFIETGDDQARLVTAYPVKRSARDASRTR